MKNTQKLLLSTFLLAALTTTLVDAKILFVSFNQPAEEAVEELVIREYNYQNNFLTYYEEKSVENSNEDTPEPSFDTFQQTADFQGADEIPNFQTLLNNRMDELGLSEGDPADKGFTDFLVENGFSVDRSTGQLGPDGDTDSLEYVRELTPAIKDELNSYDLIIFSRNTGSGRSFAKSGDGVEGFLQRVRDWNGLSVPMIVMNPNIPTGTEWGFNWGWTYGYTFSPNTVLKFRINKQTGELGAVQSYDQKVLKSDDPIFSNVTIPQNGFVDIYDDTVFLPTSIQKFENNQNYDYALAEIPVLEYDPPSFFAAGIDIETKNPLIIRLVTGRRLFSLDQDPAGLRDGGQSLTASDLQQTVSGPRLYFAAGMTDKGIFNLNETGQQLLLNAVSEHVTPGAINPWGSLTPDGMGFKTTSTGTINDATFPYCWHLELNSWIFVDSNSITSESIFAFDFSTSKWIALSLNASSWYYEFNSSGGTWGSF